MVKAAWMHILNNLNQQRITELTYQLAERNEQLAQRDATILELRVQLTQRDATIAALRQEAVGSEYSQCR